MTNYIIPINKGEKREKTLFLYDSAINIHIISCLLTKNRKERQQSFLFCLYDSAINIHVFICLVIKINCMYT